jgi:hypothetical protein
MPCIFCIAAVVMIAGALVSTLVDEMESRLSEAAGGRLTRATDTESVTKWNLEARIGKKNVPVDVTFYKQHGRARIQILTHQLSREEVEALEDLIAEAIGATVVFRTSEAEEQKVREEGDDVETVAVESGPAQTAQAEEPRRAGPVEKGSP